jgi:serine/threonine protein kinase
MIQNRPYDYKIDIWALGILVFELIAGHAPFRGDKPEEVLEQMKTKIYFCERFGISSPTQTSKISTSSRLYSGSLPRKGPPSRRFWNSPSSRSKTPPRTRTTQRPPPPTPRTPR